MPKNAVANRSAIQVIDRLCDLMNALMMNGGQTSLKVLAAETGLHPSTAFRILSSAIDNGWVSRNDFGQYVLGRQLIGLAQQSQVAIDVRLEALPLMKKLRQQLGETVNLTFREGDAVVYVERVVSTRTSHVGRIVGSRAPLHVTAVGKLFLGSRGEKEIRTYASREGYALDNEEAELGVGCIGVPIINARGEMIAGLSISAPAKRRKLEWIPDVLACGRTLSERLGHQPR